jgi:NAD(P)-dependent dehydrogenase (short-subunit alcohol dehydrogenase family)
MPSTVLITGANRGIGLALAKHYASSGDAVLATARTPNAATELARLAAGNPEVTIEALDVTDDASIAVLSKRLAGKPIDVLICNAGVIGPRESIPTSKYSHAIWHEVLSTNVAGPYQTVQALLSNLEKATGAKIALISSSMGSTSRADGGYYAYRASKAGLANLAANLAVDLRGRRIAVAAYHPGWVRTDMGGPSATLDAATSARGLASRIERLSLATSGVFEDYSGRPIPY